MGIEIEETEFNPADYKRFQEKLARNLTALGQLLARPAFGCGPGSIGAELELYLVDVQGHPLFRNEEILERADDPQLTLELNRYNLEYNLTPYALRDAPFRATEQEMVTQLNILNQLAGEYQGRVVPIGILPTLRREDFGSHSITDRNRYHVLARQLRRQRGEKFYIDIDGEDPLQLETNDVTLEGANTSFQIHYRVAPAQYRDTYNAIQFALPLVVAIAANSPGIFGHSLWHETRIPLFKQSIDSRPPAGSDHQKARVCFGYDWISEGAEELFAKGVTTFRPVMPICDEEDPLAVLDQSGVPSLSELQLHQSSIWLWTRPVYDAADGGHLRIEMRALPAGPTAVDMTANAALMIGLAEGFRSEMPVISRQLTFAQAEHNFYLAARFGLQAKLLWPSEDGLQERTASDILDESLPVAKAGLQEIGIANEEYDHYLAVIKTRLQTGQTGTIWQHRALEKLSTRCDRNTAFHHLLEAYMERSQANAPVGQWSLP